VSAAICAASLSNIVGMFATPLLAGLLLSPAHGAGFSITALETIVLQLLAPFLLGQLLQPLVGNWIRARRKLLSPVDRGSILMVVYLAFSDAVTEGLWHTLSVSNIATVLAVDMTILFTVLLLTTLSSRTLGFCTEDEITIAFCGSKKSLASGIPMANAIFAGPTASIGAVVLPLMFFHQAQLMACAVIAHRYAARLRNGSNEPNPVLTTSPSR
ncbi:bile acid:sodium symporter, partial [Mesorhizobium sp. M1A.F.Ca.IN.022.05.2.1]